MNTTAIAARSMFEIVSGVGDGLGPARIRGVGVETGVAVAVSDAVGLGDNVGDAVGLGKDFGVGD